MLLQPFEAKEIVLRIAKTFHCPLQLNILTPVKESLFSVSVLRRFGIYAGMAESAEYNLQKKWMMHIRKYTYRHELYTDAVRDFLHECISNHMSKRKIAKALSISSQTLDKLLNDLGIAYDGKQCMELLDYIESGHYVKLQDYLQKNKRPNSTAIRHKLIIEGYKDAVCENCRRREWLNEPIPLQLHHIDGNHNNNSIDNFQLLCPNCHALTPNYCRRKVPNNIRLIDKSLQVSTAEVVQDGDTLDQKPQEQNIQDKNSSIISLKQGNLCIDCGKPVDRKAIRCVQCAALRRRKCVRPDKETLLALVVSESFCSIGRRYGVTDNTVRKWCKHYGLPYNSQTLKDYCNRFCEYDD